MLHNAVSACAQRSVKPDSYAVERMEISSIFSARLGITQRGVLALCAISLLFSGLIQAVISPPLNWLWLHLISWVPAFWVFSFLDGRRAFLAGWLVGISANLAIFYWLPITAHNYLAIPVLLTPLLLLLFAAGVGFYVAVFSWGFQHIRRISGSFWPFAVAAWFCALEFLMPQLFTYYQGVAWYQQPEIFLVSSVTGVSGVSFLVILTNALVLQLLEAALWQRKERMALIANMTVYACMLLLVFTYSLKRMDHIAQVEAEAGEIEVALIQPNYSVERKQILQRETSGSFARDLIALSRQIAATTPDPVDVYIWPENALPGSPAKDSHEPVLDFARQQGAEIWTGATYQERHRAHTGVYRNSAFRIDARGNIDTRYDKTLLIPFGEYVPFRDVLPGADRIHLPGNFNAGVGPVVHKVDLAKFSFLICYEVIKSGYVRKAILDGADLLVNVSGDVRSGNHSEQSQYLMLAAVQSAQYGVPQVRSTSTGISAIVDARGMITAKTKVFERGGLVGTVRPVQVESIYAKHGDWFAALCITFSIILLVIGRGLKRKRFYLTEKRN